MEETTDLTVRGQTVRFTSDGLARLGDIWTASGNPKNRTPADWLKRAGTIRLINALLEKLTGKSHSWTKSETRSGYYVERGIGTFADVRLALAYAEYLDPTLSLEIKEVFLRFKGADPRLADEVLQRAGPEANEWAARRAMGRAVRNQYTNELNARGVKDGKEYAICTNTTYRQLFEGSAQEIKISRGLPSKVTVRDALSIRELAFLAASEALSVERMEDEDSQGFNECRSATNKSASAIKTAIDSDRRSRKKS